MPIASVGLQLGPYQLVSAVGAGGMGEVWKGRDTRLNRTVAIKISQQQFSERFESEAHSIAALNHPNICALYDIGPDYLVMEYVDGSPLTHVQGIRKLLDIALQIADGMAAAHAAGIVHRDLKPDNVLLTRDGHVKILDFGLAKHESPATSVDSDQNPTASITRPGVVMGTVAYMSPEQARGLPLDERSDQFSFGVMIYELASGKRPFQGASSVQTMSAIIETDPEPLPASVPAPLRWIVERCLAKEPSGRYESTCDLYRDLSSLRDHISEAVQVSPPVRHRRRRLVFSVIGTLGLIVAGALCFWLGLRINSGPQALVSVPFTSSGGIVQNPSFSPDGSQVVFAWNGPRQTTFNLYVKLIGSNDTLRLTNDASDEGSPAWSPDGKHIAFVRGLGNGKCAVLLTSPLGGAERKLTEIRATDVSPEGHSLLAWTPDSRYLAVPDGPSVDVAQGLYLVSVDSADRKPLTMLSQAERKAGGYDLDPAFSPDGNRLAFVREKGLFSSRALWIQLGPGYVPAGVPREVRTSGLLNFSPLWTSSGQIVFSSGVLYSLRLYGAARLDEPATPLGDVLTSGGLALNNKTGRLMFSSGDLIQNLVQFPLTGAGEVAHSPEPLTATTGSDAFPLYSPDGKSVAFDSQRHGEYGIWTIQTQATTGAELTSSRDATLGLGDWAPDGMSILFFATTTHSWWQLFRVAVDTRRVTQLTNGAAHSVFPTSSKDGKWIYFSSTRSGQTWLYRMPSSGGSATVVVPRSVVNAHESPDGQWLYFADWLRGGLSRMPVSGGKIERIIDQISDPIGYTVNARGVYYWAGNFLHIKLRFHDIESHRDTLVFQPAIPASAHLTISPDGRYLCYPQIERNSQELMLIENFR